MNCYGDTSGTVEGHGWYALDLSTNPASYTALFTIPKRPGGAGTFPYIAAMNGASLSPKDSYVYALVKVQISSGGALEKRLVRL